MAAQPDPPPGPPDWEAIHRWRSAILQPYLDARLLQYDETDGYGNEILYRAGQLVVAEADVERFRALPILAGLRFDATEDVSVPLPPDRRRDGYPTQHRGGRPCAGGRRPALRRPRPGLARTHRVFQFDPDQIDVAGLARSIRGDFSPAGPILVAPNHVVTGLQRRLGWPSGDPEPAGRLPRLPDAKHPEAGEGIRIAILDTGFPETHLPEHMDWFSHDTSWWSMPGEPSHVDEVDGPPANGFLDAEAGHALFIGGLIRRLAPRAHLIFLKCLNSDGVGTEAGVAQAIGWAVRRRPHIITMSLGGYTLANEASISEDAAIDQARRLVPGVAVLAAAGNDGVTSMAFPAALKHVVAVGALDAARTRVAATSNRGPWVDVYAPGTDLRSTYLIGTEEPTVPPLDPTDTEPDDFGTGSARWSGTSFATAIVAGLLARRLSPSGAPLARLHPARRLRALLDGARHRGPDGTPFLTPPRS